MITRNKRIVTKIILALILLMVMMTGCAGAEASSKTGNDNLLNTAVLKIGKADAIVIWQNEHAMLIDCGEEEDGQEIIDYLARIGIDHVETMIITHYDKDHVGGADFVIENIPVDRILVPDYEGSSTDYHDFMTAVDAAGMTLERLTESVSFAFGDALVTVDAPLDYSIAAKVHTNPNVEIDNNLSLITTIVHGSNRLVYMGDAEKARIKEFLTTDAAVDCDFLKVPHHGVYNTELINLIETVTPEYAAICDSQKNPASQETLQLLKDKGITTRQTMAGRITVISDGKKVDIQQKVK